MPREVHFFAKEELFRKPVFARLIRYLNAFPVRRGQFDRESLAVCLDVLKNDGALIFFPEGTRAPADGFLKAKLGLGWVVCLSERAGRAGLHSRQRTHTTLRAVANDRASTWFSAADGGVRAGRPRACAAKTCTSMISDRGLELIRELSLSDAAAAGCRESGRFTIVRLSITNVYDNLV